MAASPGRGLSDLEEAPGPPYPVPGGRTHIRMRGGMALRRAKAAAGREPPFWRLARPVIRLGLDSRRSARNGEGVIDVFNKNRPGRSAEKRYERLADAWLDRTFGKRYSLYFWTVFVVAVLVIVDLPLTRHWALFAGLLLGASFVGWMLVPAALLPGHIFSWQMGAWGE